MPQHAFLAQLEPLFKQQSEDALAVFREKSWQALLERGFPIKADEAFRYIPLKELYLAPFEFSLPKAVNKAEFSESILPECARSHLVFVDGCFASELSDLTALPEQLVLLPLQEAIRSQASFLQAHLFRILKEETDPFALANLALHAPGTFIYLPPKIQHTTPIQCLHIATGQSLIPRIHLVLGAESKLRVINTYHSLAKTDLCLPALDIALEEGASLNLLSLLDRKSASWHLESIRATLKKNARLDSLCITTGAKAVRQSYRAQLKGENSEAKINGLSMLNQSHTAHTHVLMHHEAPYTRSMQLFKSALNDNSQASFEGKIWVHPDAQKTEAYQLNNTLILGQGAISYSKPNLEVFADDVKASHGATVSQLDDEQLFYLNTRGISTNDAKQLLIAGFCREMIQQIPYPSVLQNMQRQIEAFVNSGGV